MSCEARTINVAQAGAAIAAHLANGLPLDAGSLETILLALGEADPARAFALLAADPEASEHTPLLALAFSPGARTRRLLEPALAQADLDIQGAEVLAREAARLVALGAPVALLLPDGARLELPAEMPELAACVDGFVRRLRPEATAPAELRRILSQSNWDRADGDEADLAALLRHCRLEWTPCRVFFMAALLERGSGQEGLFNLTAWAVGFLDLAGRDFDPREALRQRRQELLRQVHMAEAQEEAQERTSFEVRLSQGQRPGHVHGPDLRAELALLDRAWTLVLGARETEYGVAEVRDLGEALDVQAVLRLFAR